MGWVVDTQAKVNNFSIFFLPLLVTSKLLTTSLCQTQLKSSGAEYSDINT